MPEYGVSTPRVTSVTRTPDTGRMRKLFTTCTCACPPPTSTRSCCIAPRCCIAAICLGARLEAIAWSEHRCCGDSRPSCLSGDPPPMLCQRLDEPLARPGRIHQRIEKGAAIPLGEPEAVMLGNNAMGVAAASAVTRRSVSLRGHGGSKLLLNISLHTLSCRVKVAEPHSGKLGEAVIGHTRGRASVIRSRATDAFIVGEGAHNVVVSKAQALLA